MKPPQSILLKISTSLRMNLSFSDITYIQADGQESRVLTSNNKNYRSGKPLGKIETLLKPHGFIRCHRHFLINAEYVDRLVPRASRDYDVILKVKGKTRIPISRHKLKDVKQAFICL